MNINIFRKLPFQENKIFFAIFFIVILLTIMPVKGFSQTSAIDAQTLDRIRMTLHISSAEISDERLREVLNREKELGISEGHWIYGLIKQMEFGLQLKSGNYYTRYYEYFNNLIDEKTTDPFWSQLLKYWFQNSVNYISQAAEIAPSFR